MITRMLKISVAVFSLFGLTACPVALLDVRPRGDDIVYGSYTEAYDEAYEECTQNQRFADKTLAECLKVLDFQENVNYRSMDDFSNQGGDDE
ncbi:MAG: hypothetical protein COV35_04550 [Alphaproteobacteria bacterium CG11_big_fil_rev_8_21_14_0_20_39_49]|nr:MAG: hypothetical protein COV35_04550 [Alphaproteobacteria bacterium CG11_big_fil_rev_8_21_14_0_20_39_49]